MRWRIIIFLLAIVVMCVAAWPEIKGSGPKSFDAEERVARQAEPLPEISIRKSLEPTLGDLAGGGGGGGRPGGGRSGSPKPVDESGSLKPVDESGSLSNAKLEELLKGYSEALLERQLRNQRELLRLRREKALEEDEREKSRPLKSVSDEECRARLLQLGIAISAGPCTDVGAIVVNLAKGTYFFNKPSTAILGEPFSLRVTLTTAEGQPVDFAGLPGNVERRESRPFAQSIEATLIADDFEISPSGPQGRTATFAHPVNWDWKLKPTSAGKKALTIEVTANILTGSDKHRVQITTLHEIIEIQVTVFQRLKAYVADASGMIIAAGAVVTPLAALIAFVPKIRTFLRDVLKRLRRRNRRGAREAAR
jgi:hypothetical protein